MNRIKLIIALCLTTNLGCLLAQDSNLGNWLIYFGNKKIDNRLNWHHELQYRNYNAIGDLEQLLIRTGLGYNLTENNNNLLMGYGYILSANYVNADEKESIEEHRIYQQFITHQRFPKISFQHRYRFEQRFIEENFRVRFRYFLGVNVPVSRREDGSTEFYLSAYNEIFINGDGVRFDRNRVYGGLGYRFNNRVRTELGYMTQIFSEGSRDQANMVVFFSF